MEGQALRENLTGGYTTATKCQDVGSDGPHAGEALAEGGGGQERHGCQGPIGAAVWKVAALF